MRTEVDARAKPSRLLSDEAAMLETSDQDAVERFQRKVLVAAKPLDADVRSGMTDMITTALSGITALGDLEEHATAREMLVSLVMALEDAVCEATHGSMLASGRPWQP